MRRLLIVCSLIGLQHVTSAAQTGSVTPTSVSPKARGHLPEERLEDCKAELARTVQALQNVDIRFVVKVDYLIPNLPRVTGENGEIYLDDGKMYYRFERTFPPLPGRPHVVELEEEAYDGDVYYLGKNSTPGNPSIKTMLGDNAGSAHASQHFTKTCLYLEAAGYRLPRKVAQWKSGRLTSIVLDYLSEGKVTSAAINKDGDSLLEIKVTIPDPSVFDAVKTDLDLLAEEMEQNGSDHAEIEKEIDAIKQLRASGRKRQVDMWLDPGKKYALVRRVESTPDGKMIYEIEASDFQQFGDRGVWLPNTCTINTFVKDARMVRRFTSEPNRTDSIQLGSVSFQPRDDIAFALDYGPGTSMVDRSSDAAKSSPSGQVVYIKPAPLDELRDAARAKRGWQWLIITNVILFILLAGLGIRRFLNR